MEESKKAVILGAGALGAFFATRFIQLNEFSTSFLAKGRRHENLKGNGVIVNGEEHFIPVTNPDDETGPADLIIVALKHHNLPEAINDLKNLVGENTIIISVMNGLDSEEYIGSVYGIDKLLYSILVGIDAVRDGNRIRYTNPGKLFFGEADNKDISQRVKQVGKLLDRAGIIHETPKDMIRTLWWKFMINVGMNQASAVMRAEYGIFQSSAEARELMTVLMFEVISLAESIGINLREKDLEDWNEFLYKMSPDGKSSMLQDIEAGRKTEIEMFAGKVVELGKDHGVPTPVNQAMLNIIKVLEQKAA